MADDQFAAFRHTSYQRYFAARFFAAFAAYVLSTAVGYHLYDVTQDVALLGFIGLVQFLPALLLVLVTGLASDRLGRRFVMGTAIFCMAVGVLVILSMAVTNNFDPFWVLTMLCLIGIARAFFSPASASLAVNVVPRKDFPNAVGWNASSWQAASILGPAIGGVLQFISNAAAYSAAFVMFALAGFLIFSIPKPPQRVSKEPTNLETLLGGFAYIRKQRIVLGAISLDLFAVLLGGAVALLPVYARDILEVGRIGNGLLRAAPGIGAVGMIIYLTKFPIRNHAGIILFVSVALFGLSTVIFGHSTIAWLSILALIAVGAFDMVSVYIREVLLQLWTPDEVRGRVNAVNSIFVGASNQLGEARAGFMAAIWGSVFTVVIGGYLAVGVAGFWAYMFPEMRKTKDLQGGGVE